VGKTSVTAMVVLAILLVAICPMLNEMIDFQEDEESSVAYSSIAATSARDFPPGLMFL